MLEYIITKRSVICIWKGSQHSLSCKLVPVLHREYEIRYVKLSTLDTWHSTLDLHAIFHFWKSGRKRPRNLDFVTQVKVRAEKNTINEWKKCPPQPRRSYCLNALKWNEGNTYFYIILFWVKWNLTGYYVQCTRSMLSMPQEKCFHVSTLTRCSLLSARCSHVEIQETVLH